MGESPIRIVTSPLDAVGSTNANAFWTSVVLLLSGPYFHLGAAGIGVFAFAGAGGAIAAPLAGRAADAGYSSRATVIAHLLVIAALVLAGVAGTAPSASDEYRWPAIVSLGFAAIVLDAGAVADQAIGRSAINLLDPAARGRLNGLFTRLFFLGSAGGAALSGLTWLVGGWPAVCGSAGLLSLAAFVLAARRLWRVSICRPCLCCGGSMIHPSWSPAPKPIAATCRTPKFTS